MRLGEGPFAVDVGRQRVLIFGSKSKLLGRIKAPRKPPREILEGLAQGGWPDILARYMFLNFRTPVFLEFPTCKCKFGPNSFLF